MQKLSDIARFKEEQNILLQGFDPVSAGGFTQVPNHMLNNKDLSAVAKLVYAKLLSYAWNNNLVFPGQETMAEDIGLSKSTVNRGIQELEEKGWLEIQRRGQGKTNLYVLTHTVKPKKRGRFPPAGI
jgi:DNA-binding MarR family transcriptional regulator